jgi:hypothetical protein
MNALQEDNGQIKNLASVRKNDVGPWVLTWEGLKNHIVGLGVMFYVYNPSYLGGGGQEDLSLKTAWAKS